jgi:hypothetical protein
MVIRKPFLHSIQITRKKNACKYIHIRIQRNLETPVLIYYGHITETSVVEDQFDAGLRNGFPSPASFQ